MGRKDESRTAEPQRGDIDARPMLPRWGSAVLRKLPTTVDMPPLRGYSGTAASKQLHPTRSRQESLAALQALQQLVKRAQQFLPTLLGLGFQALGEDFALGEVVQAGREDVFLGPEGAAGH